MILCTGEIENKTSSSSCGPDDISGGLPSEQSGVLHITRDRIIMPHINPKQSPAHPGFIFYDNAGRPRPSQVPMVWCGHVSGYNVRWCSRV